MSDAKLGIVVRRDQRVVSTHVLAEEVVKIGRAPKSHIPLDDENVSRMHAILERRDDGWRLIDLGSAAGTRVGGRSVNSCPLAVRDVIEIGPFTLELVLAHELSGAPPEVPSSPAPARPSKPTLPCPACGSLEPRVETELHTHFAAPGVSFDAPDMLTRVRAELCRDCGHIALFLRDPKAVVPRE